MSELKETAIARLRRARGFLLDYDGLLVDTESIYFQTWSSILDEEGRRMCAAYHHGRHESEVYTFVKDHIARELSSLQDVSAYREKAFHTIVERDGIRLMPGWLPLVSKMVGRGVVFVVSNSIREDVLWGLKRLGIDGLLTGVVGFGDGAKRKPDPFLYNLAVRASGVPTAELIAFEDSPSGLVAAQAADVYAICVSDTKEAAVFSKERTIPCFGSALEILDLMGR